VNVVRGDLLNRDEIGETLKEIRPEICIHVAWYAVPGKYLTSYENVNMLHGTISLVNQLAKVGCNRFVGVGTCIEYDTNLGYLSEKSATKPRNLYAACKLSTCNILTQLCRDLGMGFAWARLFYQYGPTEDKTRFVPSVIHSLLGGERTIVKNGDLRRDFLHVEDTAAAIWSVAGSHLSGPVNIGSAEAPSLGDIALTIGEILGRPNLVEVETATQDEPKLICADTSLLRKNTAWTPNYDLAEGLRQTVAWWQTRCVEDSTSLLAERISEGRRISEERA
jgi:nucleoside-diphosphate-sugar epimerase